jgi:hypothetical protein
MAMPATSGDQPFNIEDCWVYPFTAGVPGGGVDVPGIVQVTGAPQNTVVEHRGDGTVIAKVATFDSIDLTVTIGAWNQLALSKLVGGTVGSVVGATPNQTISLTHKSTDAASDCAISVQTHSRSADGGQTRLTWPRCQPQNIPSYGLNDQVFVDLDVPMSAVANAASEMVIYTRYESSVTLLTSTYTP